MRRTLFLIISLLAASAAMTTAASAHDYHRSRHAVETSHGGHHPKARYHRDERRHCKTRRGHRRTCPPKRHFRRYAARSPFWSPFVIVISPNGHFRVARRYR
jgi:Ni/Co efflux regulator RcnB